MLIPCGNSLEHLDPVLYQYNRAVERNGEQEFFKKTLEDLVWGVSVRDQTRGESRQRHLNSDSLSRASAL